MRITEEEMKLRRERMIHEAYRLFNENGIDGISLEKVARAANVSPKSIFRYFKNKAQLVEQTQIILWRELVDCITANHLKARQESENGLEEMRIILGGYEELYRDHSDYILFSYDYQAYCIRKHIILSEEHFEKMLSDVRPLFMRALERGQKDRSISADISPSDSFLMIWGIMRYYVEKIVVHNRLYACKDPWEVMYPALLDKILEMLSP